MAYIKSNDACYFWGDRGRKGKRKGVNSCLRRGKSSAAAFEVRGFRAAMRSRPQHCKWGPPSLQRVRHPATG